MNSCYYLRMPTYTFICIILYSTIMSVASTKVGFIGLGIMGNGMCNRLLAGSSSLVIWNRSSDKCDQLKSKYSDRVTVASTPAEVIAACDITFCMLSTPEACKDVYTSDNGILKGVTQGKRIIDCATVNAEDMEWSCKEVTSRGGVFVEAPVSGSKGPAESGQLIFMAAGDQKLIEDAKEYFALMGKATHNLGASVGAASKMKLVINSIMGNMLACFSEGLHLAEASDLPTSSFLEIISQGAINTPMFAMKGPKMIAGDHTPNFPLKHAWKDIRFAIDLSKQLGVDCAMSSTASTIYQKADEEGLGDLDFSAIGEVGKKTKK